MKYKNRPKNCCLTIALTDSKADEIYGCFYFGIAVYDSNHVSKQIKDSIIDRLVNDLQNHLVAPATALTNLPTRVESHRMRWSNYWVVLT